MEKKLDSLTGFTVVGPRLMNNTAVLASFFISLYSLIIIRRTELSFTYSLF